MSAFFQAEIMESESYSPLLKLGHVTVADNNMSGKFAPRFFKIKL